MAEIVFTENDIKRLGFTFCGNAFASSLEPVIENGSSSTSGSSSGTEIKEAAVAVYDLKKEFQPNMIVGAARAYDTVEKDIDDKKEEAEKSGTEQAD